MFNHHKFFFIGIKGTGMSALALVLHDLGYEVAGSDIEKKTFTEQPLVQAGIQIHPFDVANIQSGWQYIAGNAFTDEHPEIAAALAHHYPLVRYHQALGELLKNYTSIGVAGAHGKTSTTGLLAHVLGGVASTSYLIGDGTGKGVKEAQFFVFEADEYRRHFLAYSPDYTIMTNIDFDHPDYFKDINDVAAAFQQEAYQTQKGIFAWGDDVHLRALKADVPIYYYGVQDNDDFQAQNIVRTPAGSSFDVYHQGQIIGHFAIPMVGQHAILNSLAVIGVSNLEGLDMSLVNRELESFTGVKRRFNESHVGTNVVIDDYAHHPSEIKATLDAARQKYPDRQLVAVFQPHTYSRTQALLPGFVESLDLADQIYLTEIFGSAREQSGHISSLDLAKALHHGGKIIHMDDFQDLPDLQQAVIIFMGAGDIPKYEERYRQIMAER